MRLSSVDVALPEVLAVIAVDVLAIYLILRGAAKIFRVRTFPMLVPDDAERGFIDFSRCL